MSDVARKHCGGVYLFGRPSDLQTLSQHQNQTLRALAALKRVPLQTHEHQSKQHLSLCGEQGASKQDKNKSNTVSKPDVIPQAKQQ